MNGIYIHIPFCNSICSYCDFPKQLAKRETKEIYMEHLLKELSSYEKQDWFSSKWALKTESVYIGGGTPNSLSLSQLERLFQALKPYLSRSKENTIEINPELLTEEQVSLFKRYGINRISIGVQTLNPKLIQIIRRNHTEQIVKEAVKLLKKCGITNINLDMMYGLPGQTLKDVKQDVKKILHLDVPHISYYSLIVEEKTILSYELKHSQTQLPDDDSVVDMANYLTKKLKKRQFIHYEISNYAKKGYESTHNLGYWSCFEYLGIGASACSYFQHKRIQNPSSLVKYYRNEERICTPISSKEAKKEFMMLGLRKLNGISVDDYFQRFKTYPKDDFDLVSLFKKGLIEEKNGLIRIKEDKIWLGNLVFEAFVGGAEDEE
ncbi:MAG: radical SAM family heme chaperone HemW [Anaeroplasmataceae bacterium]|nr:radical SAM family heme chaperone HemW [Anaeroplasmataceae bacterium]